MSVCGYNLWHGRKMFLISRTELNYEDYSPVGSTRKGYN